MRRSLLVLAAFFMMAVSGQDAHALRFGTRDKVHHLQNLKDKGPSGEAMSLGFLTTTHSFMLPYTMSDGGYVLIIRGKYYRLSKERIEQLQRAGGLPNPLPVYRRSAGDYVTGYTLWFVPAIFVVLGFFLTRKREAIAHGETRPA